MPRILNRNILKYIAVLMMVIDHVTMFFMNPVTNPILYFVLRLLGRLTIPIMCYFIAEGYFYTKSKLKYGLRLGIFALVSQFAFTFALQGTIFTLELLYEWNVIFTLFIGFFMLYAYDHVTNKSLKFFLVGVLFVLSYFGDWGIFATLWIFIFYQFRNQTTLKYLLFILIALLRVILIYSNALYNQLEWYLYIWQIGVIFVIPLILMYNDKPGNKGLFHRYFFYVFYPLHLVLLRVIVMLIVYYR